MRNVANLILISGLFLGGCGMTDEDVSQGQDEQSASFLGDSALDSRADGLGISTQETRAILEVVNTMTQTELDEDVRLDARAAANIVKTRDSGLFTTLQQLDDVPYVGPTAFGLLRTFVAEQGLIEAVAVSASVLVANAYDVEISGPLAQELYFAADVEEVAFFPGARANYEQPVPLEILGYRKAIAGDFLRCEVNVRVERYTCRFVADVSSADLAADSVTVGVNKRGSAMIWNRLDVVFPSQIDGIETTCNTSDDCSYTFDLTMFDVRDNRN
jgi:hypothetical protein